ncbi:MAG: DNA/RNA non-specific endonuclease [Myxococcaceae bacterium]
MPTTTIAGVTVHNAVASTTGSWNRSTAREVSIAELQRKFGWSETSVQSELMRAADAASTTVTRRRNGSVSAAELQRYLANPTDARFLTSTAMQQHRDALESKLSGRARSVAVDAFDSNWQDAVARKADLISGDADGKLSLSELEVYLQRTRAGRVDESIWVSDQAVAVHESRVAEAAGEKDPLRPVGDTPGLSLVKEYMRLSLDEAKNVPTFVSYLLSAADVKETPNEVSRAESRFVRDPAVRAGVTDGDYVRTGFDRGHMKPAEDSPTQAAMDESHFMSNIAPQHGNHNQQTWRTLEEAVSDLVKATGGKAHIITGNLYLDANGKPLPPEKVQTIGSQTRSIAVPTHNFKTVLLELPNKSLTAFAYLVPNIKNSPIRREEVIPFLEKSRVPVDRIEELLGMDLYSQLPKRVQERMEKDTDARIAFQNSSQYYSATLLWPQ